jgi:hypothetical protein
MRRALLLLLAALLFVEGGSVLLAAAPPKPMGTKPPPPKPPKPKPMPPKPGDDGKVLSQKLIKSVIKGNFVIETYEVTRRRYTWDGSKWVPGVSKSIEQVTKALPGGGNGGVIPETVTDGPPPDTGIGEVTATPYVAAYLRIENQTGEKIRVFVQFRALNERDEWVWQPANPKESDKGDRYTYDVSESAVLEDSAGKVRASRVRIWAESDSGKVWKKYKDEDFWLVPEDTEGKRRYFAPNIRTRVFTFRN